MLARDRGCSPWNNIVRRDYTMGGLNQVARNQNMKKKKAKNHILVFLRIDKIKNFQIYIENNCSNDACCHLDI